MIAPQLPTDSIVDPQSGVTRRVNMGDLPHLCAADGYAVTQKVNGRRLMLVVDNGDVEGLNKYGKPTSVPDNVRREVARTNGQWVFDGELVDGGLVLFDMPRAGQLDATTSYRVRRTVLGSLFEHWGPDPTAVRLLPVAWTMEQKALLAKRLYVGRAEGCMINGVEAPYTSGAENPRLLRVKFTKTVDCVVIDVGRDGKDNMAVGCYVPGYPNPVEVAEVTACAGDGPQIVAQYRQYLEGKAPRPVVEVTYLMASASDRLIQPTRPILRDDITDPTTKCTIDQLQHEGKELLDV